MAQLQRDLVDLGRRLDSSVAPLPAAGAAKAKPEVKKKTKGASKQTKDKPSKPKQVSEQESDEGELEVAALGGSLPLPVVSQALPSEALSDSEGELEVEGSSPLKAVVSMASTAAPSLQPSRVVNQNRMTSASEEVSNEPFQDASVSTEGFHVAVNAMGAASSGGLEGDDEDEGGALEVSSIAKPSRMANLTVVSGQMGEALSDDSDDSADSEGGKAVAGLAPPKVVVPSRPVENLLWRGSSAAVKEEEESLWE